MPRTPKAFRSEIFLRIPLVPIGFPALKYICSCRRNDKSYGAEKARVTLHVRSTYT